MIWPLAFFLALTLGVSCTKKKEPEAEVPADSVHMAADKKLRVVAGNLKKPDENGAIFEKTKISPVQILKMKEIENKAKTYTFSKDNTSKGKAVYLSNCSRCHGVEGRGDGPDERSMNIAPTNLREWKLKYGSSLQDLVFTITYGRSEGEMPPFLEILSEEEIWTVAHYVEAWTAANN